MILSTMQIRLVSLNQFSFVLIVYELWDFSKNKTERQTQKFVIGPIENRVAIGPVENRVLLIDNSLL